MPLEKTWLETARVTDERGNRKVTDEQLADYIASKDPAFKQKLAKARMKGLQIQDDDGSDIGLETALLNFEAYGTVKGSGQPAPAPKLDIREVLDDPPRGLLDPVPLEQGATVGGFAKNVLKSGGRLVRDTVKGVTQLGAGAAAKGAEMLSGIDLPDVTGGEAAVEGLAGLAKGAVKNTVETLAAPVMGMDRAEQIFEDPANEAAARAAGQGFVDRFGDEGIGETLYEDPLGAAADAAAAISGGGSALKAGGLAAKTAGAAKGAQKATAAGKFLLSTGEAADPLNALSSMGRPALRAAIEKAKPLMRQAQGRMANVPSDVIERAYQYPEKMQEAINAVIESPDQPYMPLARETATKLLDYEKGAVDFFESAKKSFKESSPNATFDVSQKLSQIARKLEEFNIRAEIISPKGQGFSLSSNFSDIVHGGDVVKLKQGKAKPFASKEIKLIEEAVNSIASARNFSVDDLLDMNKAFDKYYDAVRLTEQKTPKPYHAVIMGLKSGFDEAMVDILPTEMKDAYSRLSQSKKLLKDWGGKLLEGEGSARRTSQQAEEFIASLGRFNRGQRRRIIAKLEDALGVDLVNSVQLIDDARSLSKIAAQTSGRPGDIVKALILPALGTALGSAAGPVGSVAGMAAGTVLNATLASPLKTARRITEQGKRINKAPKPRRASMSVIRQLLALPERHDEE